MNAVVVGAGFGGLTAALALACAGARVTLLESEATVGGKARAARAAGATIDLGPTILTELDPLASVLARAGQRLEDTVALTRLDPALVATFPGGGQLPWHHTDSRALADALRALGPDGPRDWARFLELGRQAHALWCHFLAHGDVTGVADAARFVAPGPARAAARFAWYGSLARLMARELRTPFLRRLLGHFARFVGLEASTAPAVTIVIPYLLVTSGVWYPHGGIAALAATLAVLAEKHGATLLARAPVWWAETAKGRVRAVHTRDGRRVTGDVFVLAVDVRRAAALLHTGADMRVDRFRPAASARVAWWVVDGVAPAPTPHHALHFTGADEPIYVATPTATDGALANGSSVVHAVVHGPAGAPATPALAAGLRTRLTHAGHWPGGRVLAEGYTGDGGSCYGYAIGPGLLRAFRPSQRVPTLDNAFLAGGSVFPGPGVAGAMRSGLRAAELALASEGTR